MSRNKRPFTRSALFRRFEEASRRNLGDDETSRLLSEANRYAGNRSGIVSALKELKSRIFDSLVRRLGPLGSLFKALLRPSGRSLASADKELTAAAKLLDVFGPGTRVSPREKNQTQAAMTELLEQQGFKVAPPPPAGGAPTGRSSSGLSRRPQVEFDEWEGPQPPRVRSNYIEVKIGTGTRRFKQNDPLITGEMIKVESSNVYAIGYEFNWENPAKGSLKVRFKNNKKDGPGALYYVYNIHPDLFLKFRLAASKGGWYWDNVRVRGTVSGHQFPVELKGVGGDGYVPRKATRFGNAEHYIPRSMKARGIKTGQVRTLESALPAQRVRSLPDRGRPNRARPNRGR